MVYMTERSQNKDLTSKDDRTKATMLAIFGLLVATIFIASITFESGSSSADQPYMNLEENENEYFIMKFQLLSTELVDQGLSLAGNLSLSQNQSGNATIEGSTLGENGSIVTLPPYVQLEDRRH
jgi:hypothetical protein